MLKIRHLICIVLLLSSQLSANETWVIGASKGGVSQKILQAIATNAEAEVEFNHYGFRERLKLMQTGEIDIAAGLLRRSEREQYIHFIEPHYKEAADRIFYVLKGQKSRIQTYQDLNGLRIGITHDSKYFEQFDNDSNLLKRPESSVVINFLKLIRGEIDTLIISEDSQFRAIKELGIKDQVEIADYRYDNKTPVYIGISKKSPLMSEIEKLESIVSLMKANGDFEQISRRHYENFLESNLALTSEEQVYLDTRQNLKVCIHPGRLPIEGLDRNGQYQGIAIEVMELISDKISKPVVFRNSTSAQAALDSFYNGDCDLISSATNTADLMENTLFTSSYMTKSVVAVTQNNELFIQDSNELANHKVGVSDQYIQEQLQLRQPDITLVPVIDTREGLDKVSNGELYAYVDVLPVIAYNFQQESIIELKIAGRLEFDVEYSMATFMDNSRLQSILQKAINDISNEQFKLIEGKWLSIKFEQPIDYRNIIVISLFFIVVILIVTYKNRAITKINNQLRAANQQIQKQFKSLDEAREKAEKSEKLKAEFIANMSHEIRTPMNGIIGYLQVLEEAELAAEQKQQIDSMKQASHQLLGILNDILDLSKLEQDGIQLNIAAFSVKDLLNNIYEIFEPSFAKKSIKFTINFPKSFPNLFLGDELRIRQIVSNLTSNALKFTHQGAVTINCVYHYDKSALELIFSDTGIGIQADYFDELFTPFTQEDGHIARKYGGTGLGLNITQKLLDLMDGEITVISKPDIGTIFKVEIPLQLTEAQPDKKTDNAKELLLQIPQCRILIAEDNVTNQMVIRAMLKSPDITLEFAENGQKALDMVAESEFDLILMDVQMPVMDGLTATDKLRNEVSFEKPIIGVSANALKEDIYKALAIGMNDYLAKPILKVDLYQTLIKWLK